VRFAKLQKPDIWIIQGIASKGQLTLLEHTDASASKTTLFEPTAGGIMSRSAVKIAIDPIGRVKPAND
jgi:hypothetical protein